MPTLRFEPSGQAIEVPRGTRLIEAIRSAGLPIARACGDELLCALCGVRIRSGGVSRESALERRVKQRNRIDPQLRLACAIRVREDLVVSAEYWGGGS